MVSSFRVFQWFYRNSIASTSFINSSASKAHLTSLSSMWLRVADHTIVAIWDIWVFFVQFFHVFFPSLPDLFLISSVYQVSTIYILYCAHFGQNVHLISPVFLKRSLVSPSAVFSNFIPCSLKKAFFSLQVVLSKSKNMW